jgi:hypothetical protein
VAAAQVQRRGSADASTAIVGSPFGLVVFVEVMSRPPAVPELRVSSASRGDRRPTPAPPAMVLLTHAGSGSRTRRAGIAWPIRCQAPGLSVRANGQNFGDGG